MSRIMIVVEFEVKPEHRSAFIELMKGHAQRSRAEDGVSNSMCCYRKRTRAACFWSRRGAIKRRSTCTRRGR